MLLTQGACWEIKAYSCILQAQLDWTVSHGIAGSTPAAANSHPWPQVREGLGDGGGLTDATLELFSRVLERLPPTPSRFHYVFNLRDLSRVYEGLLRATPDRCGLGGPHMRADLPQAAVSWCQRRVLLLADLYRVIEVSSLALNPRKCEAWCVLAFRYADHCQ